jgi:uncharacterized protein
VPLLPISNGRPVVTGSSQTLGIRVALAGIRGYQITLRPLLACSCRYVPTCSEYAAQAVAMHGALRGGWMALKRVLRCHPFGGSGLDPVR